MAVPLLLALASPAAGGGGRGDGGRIVFVRNHLCRSSTQGPIDCGRGEIAVVDADGSGLRVLSHDTVTELSPKWSPDGRQIAYIRPSGGRRGTSQVWLMAADGGHQRALTRLPQGVFGGQPWPSIDWSPNGREIAFVAYPSRNGGALQLYVANARTGATKVLLPVRVGVSSGVDGPAWSPNGRWIAYTRLTRRGPYQIFLFSTATGRLHRLAPGTAPAWSPDGRRIAFDGSTAMIRIMNSNGSHARSLRVHGNAPSWSPDGKWIVFEASGRTENLAEIRPNGTGFHLISHLTPRWLNIQPDWERG